jgi:hypothetical protein
MHSDRGSQYASDEYRKLIGQFQMTQSMSQKGNCWDNAPMEARPAIGQSLRSCCVRGADSKFFAPDLTHGVPEYSTCGMVAGADEVAINSRQGQFFVEAASACQFV